jgi:hypothetical protein
VCPVPPRRLHAGVCVHQCHWYVSPSLRLESTESSTHPLPGITGMVGNLDIRHNDSCWLNFNLVCASRESLPPPPHTHAVVAVSLLGLARHKGVNLSVLGIGVDFLQVPWHAVVFPAGSRSVTRGLVVWSSAVE